VFQNVTGWPKNPAQPQRMEMLPSQEKRLEI